MLTLLTLGSRRFESEHEQWHFPDSEGQVWIALVVVIFHLFIMIVFVSFSILLLFRRKHRTSRMEKNPSILRFGSLSVKVITHSLNNKEICQEKLKNLFVANLQHCIPLRWRRPQRRSTTTLATAARQRWNGKTTTGTKRRCRPPDLLRWLFF